MPHRSLRCNDYIMKKALCLLFFAIALLAQVTEVKTTNTTVTATAGTLSCTFAAQSPVAAAGVAVSCTDTATTPVYKIAFNSPAPAVGAAAAAQGQINTAAGAVTWVFTLPLAGGPINYQVGATPTGGTASSKTGTF